MLGKEYIVDLAEQVYADTEKQKSFELFESEILRAINNNLARVIGGTSFSMSWKEVTDNKPETRTGEEIKSTILTKLHKMGGEKE